MLERVLDHLRGRSRASSILFIATISGAALAVASSGCAERYKPAEEKKEDLSVKPNDLPGEPCGSQLMVIVTHADGKRFCIDRFESSLDGESKGREHQGDVDGVIDDSDDLKTEIDGSTAARAVSALGAYPAASVTWYQAKAACRNADKRLCTVEEWERACRGPESLLYPYGNQMDEKACSGFFRFPDERPAPSGSLHTCASAFGVYDMSGNVEEWTEDSVERVPGTGVLNNRAIRGGSFKSNSSALTCVGPEFHAAPGELDIDRGFRCCLDLPER